jgi:hypothetical protein
VSQARRFLRIGAWVATPIVSAGIVSVLWWRAWMYAGWPGTPGILPQLLHADGEGVYDAYAFEMFFVALVVFAAVAFAVARSRRAV